MAKGKTSKAAGPGSGPAAPAPLQASKPGQDQTKSTEFDKFIPVSLPDISEKDVAASQKITQQEIEGRVERTIDELHPVDNRQLYEGPKSNMPAIIKTNDSAKTGTNSKGYFQPEGRDNLPNNQNRSDLPPPPLFLTAVSRSQETQTFMNVFFEFMSGLVQKSKLQVQKAKENPKMAVALILLLLVSCPAIIGVFLMAAAIGLVVAFWVAVIAAALGAVAIGLITAVAWVFVFVLSIMIVFKAGQGFYRSWITPADAA